MQWMGLTTKRRNSERMASIPIRFRRKTLNPNFSSFRFSSSSSSSTPPEPPPIRNSESEDSVTTNVPPPSIFGDIKAHLRKSPPVLRDNPPEDIRGKLDEFRSRSAPPSSATSPLSFNELYKSNVEEKFNKKHEPISFTAIRNSLRQIRQQNQNQNQNNEFFPSDFNRPTERLRNLKERLNVMQVDARGSQSSSLPRSIFGREMDKNMEMENGDKTDKTKRTDFVKLYSNEELGEKLRMLRPKESGEKDKTGKKAKGSGFSLEELNDRLAKLREIEEREKNTSKIGVSFRDLRESLEKLRDSEMQKKSSTQRFSILAHIGGFGTPEYSLGPPKEELVQTYLHPDLLSSEEKMKLELQKIRDEFKISESDCGSSRVQVAQLTVKIKHLSSVLHKKDKHSLRGLQAMVQRRRKLLKYLRRTDWDSYCFVISKLKLRDTPDIKSSRPSSSSSSQKKKTRKVRTKRKKSTKPKPTPTPTPA